MSLIGTHIRVQLGRPDLPAGGGIDRVDLPRPCSKIKTSAVVKGRPPHLCRRIGGTKVGYRFTRLQIPGVHLPFHLPGLALGPVKMAIIGGKVDPVFHHHRRTLDKIPARSKVHFTFNRLTLLGAMVFS